MLDADGLQVPYLLEKRDEPLIANVPIERKALPAASRRRQRVTSYQVHLPFQNLPNPRLVLTTKARVLPQ